MIPFWVDKSSLGRPSKFHSATLSRFQIAGCNVKSNYFKSNRSQLQIRAIFKIYIWYQGILVLTYELAKPTTLNIHLVTQSQVFKITFYTIFQAKKEQQNSQCVKGKEIHSEGHTLEKEEGKAIKEALEVTSNFKCKPVNCNSRNWIED